MSEKGNEQEQIACIFCGKAVIKEKLNLERLSNFDINWKVLQKRQMLAGPGRGKRGKNKSTGWPLIEGASLSILQMAADPFYKEIVEAIKGRLVVIVRAYLDAGIIKPSELRMKVPKKSQ